MEIIIKTVLSTLGSVALVSTFVVAFIKLNNKVENNRFDQAMDELSMSKEKEREDIYEELQKLRGNISEEINQVNNRINETESFIDSRCDKLDTKIKNLK